MAAKAVTVPKVPFDEAKFASLVEPLTVRVERISGNSRMPIPLPISEDLSLGYTTVVEDWSKDDVRGLENWLVSAWTGGGLYEISITDSSAQPATMKWSPYWDPRDYPIKVPPPLESVARPQQQPQPQVIRPMTAFPNGLPTQFQPPQQTQQQPQQQYYGAHYSMPMPPAYGTPAYAHWRGEAEDRRAQDELKAMRESREREAREALEAKHKAELERERTANEARWSRQEAANNDLRGLISNITNALQGLQQAITAKPSGESSEVAALKAQVEAQNRALETERREAAMRDSIRQAQEATQRQIDALMLQLKEQSAAMRDANANRHDPMIAMIERQTALHTEALKTLATENARSMERVQNFMMTPQSMFDLATRQTQAVDQVTDKISNQFMRVVDLQQKVTENAMQLQPGGTTAIDVVRDGVNGIKEMVERYTGMKTTEQRLAANAQVEIARAQAAVAMGQHMQQMPPQHVHVPPAPQPQAQLSGLPEEQTNGAVNANGAPKKGPVERFGRTDKEWFGPLLPDVLQLRAGVARFIESLSMDPPRLKDDGTPDGIDPQQAAMAVIQAVQIVAQSGQPIQAVVDLIAVERFADFFSVLLPDAPKNYRDDALAIFMRTVEQLERLSGGDLEDGDDDDGDDDEQDQEQHNQDLVQAKPANNASKPASKPAPGVSRRAATPS